MILVWALQLGYAKDIVRFMTVKLVHPWSLLGLDEILEASTPSIGINMDEKKSRLEKISGIRDSRRQGRPGLP